MVLGGFIISYLNYSVINILKLIFFKWLASFKLNKIIVEMTFIFGLN